MLEALRAVNDADEIDAIRAAAVLADEALEEVLAGGIVGRTERDVALALELEIAIRRRGAEGVSFFRRDSAYGGKTGIDLPEAKNYVGAYHQPASVLVDPGVLSTLSAEEVAAGYAEVVKTALIAGGALWEEVRSGADPTSEEVILGCLRTKLAAVAADERDHGRRQVLNLGHTVGHALEAATGYRRLRHGEAVALGLLCALRLSRQAELRDEVASLLRARGLSERLEGVDPGEVVALVERDKKRRGGSVPFVLVEAPGEVSPGHAIAEAELRAAIEEAVVA